MSDPIPSLRLRIKADLEFAKALQNELTGSIPHLWRGSAARMEVGIYDGGTIISNLSERGFTAISVLLKNNGSLEERQAAPIHSYSTAPSDWAVVTDLEWRQKTKQHFSVTIPAADTSDFDLEGEVTKDFWLLILGTLSDDSVVTLGAGVIRVTDSGASEVNPIEDGGHA